MSMYTERLERSTAASRVRWVDHAKGICIILVVMMHSTLGLEAAIGREGWLHAVVSFSQPFRMPDFFLVSGLFLARSIARPWPDYLDRKVLHFLYFYLLWTLVQLALKGPLDDGAGGFLAAFAYALIEPYGTLWFIAVLAVFFLVTKLMRPLPPMVLIAIAAALEIAHLSFDSTILHEAARRWVYFVVGYVFAEAIFTYADRVARHPRLALLLLALWVPVNGILVDQGLATKPGVSLALGLAGALAVVTAAALLARLRIADGLAWLGQRSITIYLAFFLPMAATRIMMVKTGIGAIDPGTAALVITIIAVLVPFAMQIVAERIGLSFLFARPRWARAAPVRVHPAE